MKPRRFEALFLIKFVLDCLAKVKKVRGKKLKVFFNIFRSIIIGLIWTYFYCAVMYNIFMLNWEFNPLAKSHWAYIFERWQGGWVINETTEIVFAALLLAFVPLWVAGWCLFAYVDYSSIAKFFGEKFKAMLPKKKQVTALEAIKKAGKTKKGKKGKKIKKKKPAKAPAASSKPVAPIPQEVVEEDSGSFEEADASDSYEYYEEPSVAPEVPEAPEEVSENVPENVEYSKEKTLQEMKDYAQENGYVTYSDMEMGKNKADLVMIAPDAIFLVTLSPEGEEWVADEESFTDEPPVWFSEEDFEVSPVHKMLEAQTLLEEMVAILLPEEYPMEVVPMVVVPNGVILNGETMMPTWVDLGCAVVRYKNGKPEELPALEQVLASRKGAPEIDDEILNYVSLALVSIAPDKEVN
jgi:hypothetical protein